LENHQDYKYRVLIIRPYLLLNPKLLKIFKKIIQIAFKGEKTLLGFASTGAGADIE